MSSGTLRFSAPDTASLYRRVLAIPLREFRRSNGAKTKIRGISSLDIAYSFPGYLELKTDEQISNPTKRFGIRQDALLADLLASLQFHASRYSIRSNGTIVLATENFKLNSQGFLQDQGSF